MPWEQGDEAEPTNPTPAGSSPVSTAAGGSSKNVPPPNAGKVDGLGQGAGTSTVKAADGMMPPASGPSNAKVSTKPPVGSAGSPAKANATNRPQPPLESTPLEGMETTTAPRLPTKVAAGDAPQDAMQGAPAVAQAATPQASRDALPSPEAGTATPVATTPSQATAPDQGGSGSGGGVDALLAELRPILEKALQAAAGQFTAQATGPGAVAAPEAVPAPAEPTAS